jgi:hypothetical protein
MTDASKSRPKFTRGWADASISFPALVILVIVMTAAALGAACINASVGAAVVAVILLAVVGLMIRWSGAPR